MMVVVTGGSGSGKSEFAENLAVSLHQNVKEVPFLYIATMLPFGKEAEARIARHRAMRAQKNFQTIECFTKLEDAPIPKGSVLLLDCMSNLVANEMYEEIGAKEEVVLAIKRGIKHLLAQCQHIVIVTNEIFTDGASYDDETLHYIKRLGEVNTMMGTMADQIIEVVCGLPIYLKGRSGAYVS